MTPSEKCLQLIRACEGFIAKPYRCPAGVPTIGYGSTRYEDGRPVSMSDPAITEKRAQELVLATLSKEYVPAVLRYVTVKLNQGQFDALVDFAYNCGAQNLRNSTLLKKVNAGDFSGAAAEFPKWVNAGGKKLPGLVKRRELERKLFLGLS